jgi:hypothetical protein
VGPRLAVTATPAHGTARLLVAHLDAGARLDLFDTSGRRIRSWSPPPGDGIVEWDGTRDDGTRVPAGLYWARVRDARGEGRVRIPWLGR